MCLHTQCVNTHAAAPVAKDQILSFFSLLLNKYMSGALSLDTYMQIATPLLAPCVYTHSHTMRHCANSWAQRSLICKLLEHFFMKMIYFPTRMQINNCSTISKWYFLHVCLTWQSCVRWSLRDTTLVLNNGNNMKNRRQCPMTEIRKNNWQLFCLFILYLFYHSVMMEMHFSNGPCGNLITIIKLFYLKFIMRGDTDQSDFK